MKQEKPRKYALFQIAKVLWHLDIFRRNFRQLTGHVCMKESCLFCALKDLFSQLQFSQNNALPLHALRHDLAKNFLDQKRFQLGFTDDAVECFEDILLRIHLHIANNEKEDICNARHCVPHQKFAMILVEQSVCGVCSATSEPLPFIQMVHYVSASALILQVKRTLLPFRNNTDLFGQHLRHAGDMGGIRECPSSCGAKIQICRTLINCPEIISIGVVWDSERPSFEHVMNVFTAISVSLRLSDVFHNVVDSHWETSIVHNLVGVVTYYEKHYSTFFLHTKLKQWIYFDDIMVEEIGPRWEQVIDKCCRDCYQPLLLLYATPSSTPINTESASNLIRQLSNKELLKTHRKSNLSNIRSENNKKRSITPNPEKPSINNTMRRAITPNSDSLPLIYIQKKVNNDYQNFTDVNNISNQNIETADSNVNSKYIDRRIVENVLYQQKRLLHVARSLSTSSLHRDNIHVPEHLNILRRRDSGNWSGDRNSASSSSSTTMDNPYLYIVNKMQKNTSFSKSPTYKSGEHFNSNNGHYDPGYDSYSLSSTESLPIQQNLKYKFQLAEIPEGNQQISTSDCEHLWMETDTLMKKALVAEKAGDLSKAVLLCTAASSKAREAMNVPYSNSNIIDLAKKKHNFCIIRMSYLQKKIKQEHVTTNNINDEKIDKYLRLSSRDKAYHMKQNSRELFVNKNIEIYATLPKKKTFHEKVTTKNGIEDEEYMLYDRPIQKIGLFDRSRHLDNEKKDKKRARSEERNKNISKEFLIPSSQSVSKLCKIENFNNLDVLNQQLNVSPLIDKKYSKKHKIRRKLLMSGLIKRKNRSMPDLRETQDSHIKPERFNFTLSKQSADDSSIKHESNEISENLCGYFSEGHLEFTGSSSQALNNSGLNKTRLMKKNVHNNTDKILHTTKVPPPPPLRTTSQLSKSKSLNEVGVNKTEKSLGPLINKNLISHQMQSKNDMYWIHKNINEGLHTNHSLSNFTNCSSEIHSLSFDPTFNLEKCLNKIPLSMPLTTYDNKFEIEDFSRYNGILQEPTFVLTHADIHNEQTQSKQKFNFDSLPPYPENVITSHSRQSSEELPPPPYPIIPLVSHLQEQNEDFPPPPSPIESSNKIELHESDINTQKFQIVDQQKIETQQITSFLGQLKLKREQILITENVKNKKKLQNSENKTQIIKKLQKPQSKQAEKQINKQELKNYDNSKKISNFSSQDKNENFRRISDIKMNSIINTELGQDVTDYTQIIHSSVRDIAAKFEQNVADIKSQQPIFPNSLNIITQDYPRIEESKSIKILNDNIFITKEQMNEHIDTIKNCFSQLPLSPNIETCMKNDSSVENQSRLNTTILSMPLTLPHENGLPIDCPENDISDIAMQNTLQNINILPNESDIVPRKLKKHICKKKSVSFCDQVVLVATAEDNEKDSHIPNPILERVLRSAMNKPETEQLLNEIRSLQKVKLNREINVPMKFEQHTLPLKNEINSKPTILLQDQSKKFDLFSNKELYLENKKLNPIHTMGEDFVKQTLLLNSNKSRETSRFPLFKKNCYVQNGNPELHQLNLIQNKQILTSYSKNHNTLAQYQKVVCPTTLQEKYKQNTLYYKNNELKTISPSKQIQVNNQTNKPFFIQHKRNTVHQITHEKNENSIVTQFEQSLHEPVRIVNGQSGNMYPQYLSQNLEYTYQNIPYETVSQQSQQLSSNSIDNYNQLSLQKIQFEQQSLQNETAIECHKKIKYPIYQNFQELKQMKSSPHQLHKLHSKTSSNAKQNSLVSQTEFSGTTIPIPCHLCHKKTVFTPEIYCSDCDFYMSRFRPKI